MAVKVKVNSTIIRDEKTGEAFRPRTLRTAREIAGLVEETEKEVISDKSHQA